MKNSRIKKSRFGFWLMCRIADKIKHYSVLGDLEEMYMEIARKKGTFRALLWYWLQMIRSLPLFTKESISGSFTMFKNYYKIAVRNILKFRLFSFINISGLGIGIACCLLIFLWVFDEISYDNFHKNGDNIYGLVSRGKTAFSTEEIAYVPGTLSSALRNTVPEIINSTRLSFYGRTLFTYKDITQYETYICIADSSFFQMFSFPFTSGNSSRPFRGLNSIVLTEKKAEIYFGDEDPIGKVLRLDNQTDMIVTGVIEKIPGNSHLKFDIVIPFEFAAKKRTFLVQPNSNTCYTYVQLPNGFSHIETNNKLMENRELLSRDTEYEIFLFPLKSIHLHSDFSFNFQGTGNIAFVYIFAIIAIFILLISCINFISLTTARYSNRAKEVGLRKVIGARKFQLIGQFLAESIIMTVLSLFIGVILVKAVISPFSSLSGKELYLGFLSDPVILMFIIASVLLVGILAGIYPAVFLSSFKPVLVLKGFFRAGSKGSFFRRFMVITQWSISIILIVSTLIVGSQLDYMRNKDLGYDRDHIVWLSFRGIKESDLNGTVIKPMKEELLKNPRILNATNSLIQLPVFMTNSTSAEWEGKQDNKKYLMHFDFVDDDFLDTFRMEIVKGRNFSRDHASDAEGAFIINETAAEMIGWDDPIGKKFTHWGLSAPVVGIVKNFHFKPLHNPIEPLILMMRQENAYLFIRIDGQDIPSTVDYIEEIWKKFSPENPFEYHFLDESFDYMYRSEEVMGTLFRYFAFLAIFIACLGLFGLSLYLAEQKTKEIGIRKVLGATDPGIIRNMSEEFIKWVLISNVIAWPVSYFLMGKWLENFAYRTDQNFQIFLGSGFLALAMALITVSFQSVKAARKNPVDSLRYE
ncbi:MAG: FtsX-like permease family protein [bacterium]|nr:FtsX-like permease family protein [bacterium]